VAQLVDAPQWCVAFPFVVDAAVRCVASGIFCRAKPSKSSLVRLRWQRSRARAQCTKIAQAFVANA
jgi:hypothetical protein